MGDKQVLKQFYNLGLDIFRLKVDDKRPSEEWKTPKNFTLDTLLKWRGNYAAALGERSNNVVVIDLDQQDLYTYFKDLKTLIVKTPNKGYHIYLKSRKKQQTQHTYLFKPIDIQADGAYVVIPPSKIKGKQYEVVKDEPIMVVDDVQALIREKMNEVIHDNSVNCIDAVKEFLGDPVNDFGKYTQYLCPFHADNDTPSFTVYEDGFKCFGCGWSGSIADFLNKHKNFSFKEVKEYLNEHGVQDTSVDFNVETKKEKQIKMLAEDINNNFNIVRDAETEDLYFYEENYNIYVELTPLMMGTIIQHNYGVTISLDDVKKIFTFFYNVRKEDKDYVGFKNGILNLKTLVLIPPTPEIFTKTHVMFNYTNAPYSQQFDQVMKEILVDDTGNSKYKFFFQMLGYLFTSDNRHHKMFFITGTGANGKSTLMQVIREIFKKYVASVPLHSFNEPFGLEPLVNKKVNILFDLPKKSLRDIGIIKAITGEDSIAISRKYKSTINIKLPVKIIGTGNVLPKVGEEGYAFFRRVFHIELLNTFTNPDPDIPEMMVNDTDGMEWLIYTAINEYHKVKDEGWAIETSVDEVAESYKRLSNPEKWVAEKVFKKTAKDNFYTREEIVRIMRVKMKEYGFQLPNTNQKYYDALRDIGGEDAKRSIEGRSERVIVGLIVRDDVELPDGVIEDVTDMMMLYK